SISPFFLLLLPPPRSPLFPYTTLFRSFTLGWPRELKRPRSLTPLTPPIPSATFSAICWFTRRSGPTILTLFSPLTPDSASSTLRSEEHTSELQSLTNLVCRLLLEKKNS